MSVLVFFFLLLYTVRFIKMNHTRVETYNISNYVEINICRKNPKLTNSEIKEYEHVEAPLFCRLSLACHYCDEPDDFLPKVWYKQSRFKNNNITELELGVEDVLAENRVYMKPDHTLVINNVIRNDSGLYFCKGVHGEDAELKYNFIVDVINGSTNVTIGKLHDWERSLKVSYTNLTNMFLASNRSDYLKIRNMGVNVNIHAEWLPWSLCNGCQQIRTRILDCKLKPTHSNVPGNTNLDNGNSSYNNQTHLTNAPLKDKVIENISLNDTSDNINSTENGLIKNYLTDGQAFFFKSFQFSCFSLDFEMLFPNISKDLQNIGIFLMTEKCYAPCKFQFKSSSLPRYKNMLTLEEGDHFTFSCPEVNSNSEVVWKKDGVIIEPHTRGENIALDSFQNLQILSASKDEEAKYTCYVDKVKMQDIIVIVHVQSTETEDFSRYALYLGFVFLACFLLYISGLVLSWYRRHTFTRINFSDLEEYSEGSTDN